MKIAPSILTADFTNLASELRSIETADLLHLDIMDGHFVPNLSFGPAIAKTIETMTELPLDVHLMVTDPFFWIEKFAFKNTKFITIHIESNHVMKTIRKIKGLGINLGLCLKPKTPVETILPFLEEAKLVLVMTVEPGFGGQSFMEDMMEKVKQLVLIREEKNLDFDIQVDGGINQETIKICQKSGVDIVVAGSYLFNMKDRKKGIEGLRCV